MDSAVSVIAAMDERRSLDIGASPTPLPADLQLQPNRIRDGVMADAETGVDGDAEWTGFQPFRFSHGRLDGERQLPSRNRHRCVALPPRLGRQRNPPSREARTGIASKTC